MWPLKLRANILVVLIFFATGPLSASAHEMYHVAVVEIEAVSQETGPCPGSPASSVSCFGTLLGAKGTAFLARNSNLLITSDHLISDLGKIDPDRLSIGVRFGGHDELRRDALIETRDLRYDLMVLRVRNAPDLDGVDLSSSPNEALNASDDEVCAYGYRLNYATLNEICGKIDRENPPWEPGLTYLWTTDFLFGNGMSGGPIFAKDTDTVVAVIKGRDRDESSHVGWAVPISYIMPSLPSIQFAEVVPSDQSSNLAIWELFDNAKVQFEHVELKQVSEEKSREFYYRNRHCQSNHTLEWRVEPQEGRLIDVDSVDIQIGQSSNTATPTITTTKDGITIRGVVRNNGSCGPRLPFSNNRAFYDGRGMLKANISYREVSITRESTSQELLFEIPAASRFSIPLEVSQLVSANIIVEQDGIWRNLEELVDTRVTTEQLEGSAVVNVLVEPR